MFDTSLVPTCLQKPTKIHQKSIKNRCQEAFHLGLHFLIDVWSVFGLNLDAFDPKKHNFIKCVQVESQNQPKIDQKMESKMECILASIFERFCWILGAKLGGKIDQKSIKNHIEKTMQKTKPFGTRLGPSSGCQGGRDVLRPNPARPSATRRAENPLSWGPPGPPHFAQKCKLK